MNSVLVLTIIVYIVRGNAWNVKIKISVGINNLEVAERIVLETNALRHAPLSRRASDPAEFTLRF